MWGKRSLVYFFTLILSVGTALADPVPCSGDPDDPAYDPNFCPLDTWVYVLVFAAVVYGAYRMYKKQQAVTV
jgi:hypothetical protein